jgi:hypothetical protein
MSRDFETSSVNLVLVSTYRIHERINRRDTQTPRTKQSTFFHEFRPLRNITLEGRRLTMISSSETTALYQSNQLVPITYLRSVDDDQNVMENE